MSASLLELSALSAGYGQTTVVKDLTLSVNPGEIVAVIGPNGAGKSTAVKSVFGLTHVFGGDIIFDGQSITRLASEKIARLGVAYVPQVANVFEQLTVDENLEMGAYLKSGNIAAIAAPIYEMFPDLAMRKRQPAGQLSGGMRQMLAMGRALMAEPQILLLDEPSAGLSPKYRAQIFETIEHIGQSGKPILLVEQNARLALTISQRAYILINGRNYRTGTAREFLDDRDIARSFLGGVPA